MRQNAEAVHLHDAALAAMRSEPRIGPHFKPSLTVDADGTATIAAEVDNVAIKRLALERLAATEGISGIVDRLRVKPALAMSGSLHEITTSGRNRLASLVKPRA